MPPAEACQGRTILHDRKTVRKLRAALDEHAPASPKSHKASTFPKISSGDSERQFERFIRAIRQCKNLSDARRFRSEIASQLKRESVVENQDTKYMRRLEAGKRILDQRISHLGAGRSTSSTMSASATASTNSTSEKATLRDVLYDATGLSYLMEYMDRLGLMRLVQFYLVVDGFRNPLTEDHDGSSGSSVYPWTEADRTDIVQLYENYMAKSELRVPDELLNPVKDFIRSGSSATSPQYQSAQRAVLAAQSWVYDEMQERYFPRFRKSDLFYKWLAAKEASTRVAEVKTNTHLTFHENTGTPGRHAKMARPSAHIASKPPDLRRTVVSSSDLRNAGGSVGIDSAPSRRSLDDSGRRASLFDDEYESDPLAGSIQSLDSEMDHSRTIENDAGVVDAMQAALNDIMDHEPDGESLVLESGLKTPADNTSLPDPFHAPRHQPTGPEKERTRPSISSLGLVGAPSKGTVFSDDLFADEEKFIEDEREDSDVNEKTEEEEIHEAAPGDLGLTEAIDELSAQIEKLVAQESIIDSLTNKAELTNNAAELRILRKSKTSLRREINRKELQRQQYIVQESDNSLYGRATVSIQSVMVGTDEDGREYALCKLTTCRS